MQTRKKEKRGKYFPSKFSCGAKILPGKVRDIMTCITLVLILPRHLANLDKVIRIYSIFEFRKQGSLLI